MLVGPSPRYLDDEGYVGGFSEEDIAGLLGSLESNYLGWSSTMAPVIMGNPDRPELGEELTNSFCRADPEIAAAFARATFLADNRRDLERVRTPSVVLQCSDDVIAPVAVDEYVHDRGCSFRLGPAFEDGAGRAVGQAMALTSSSSRWRWARTAGQPACWECST